MNFIPAHKIVKNTTYVVDYFKAEVPGATHYFLTHFHSDHYGGLTTKYTQQIYCSKTTSNILQLKYKVKTFPMEMKKIYTIQSNTVSCIEAYHCPGAVAFIFKVGTDFVLHTGDFRSKIQFVESISRYHFKYVYLDNTYEGYRSFQSQLQCIHTIFDRIYEQVSSCIIPLKYNFLVCSYSIGKEKIFLALAVLLNLSIRVSDLKFKTISCFDTYDISRLNEEAVYIVSKYSNKKRERILDSLKNRPLKAINFEVLELSTRKKTLKTKVKLCNSIYRYIKINKTEAVGNAETDTGLLDTPVSEKFQYRDIENVKKLSFDSLESDDHNNEFNTNIDSIISEVGQNKTNDIPQTISDIENVPSGLFQTPFSLISKEQKKNQIRVISTMDLFGQRLDNIVKDLMGDRVMVICGTGWKDKTVYKDWHRADGKIIRKGLEILYVPYSEHSSSDELMFFKENVSFDKIINTVKHKQIV